MARNQKYKVLYFIEGAAPTEDQREKIEDFGPNAVFRNALYADGSIEECTAVTGAVPASYAACFPLAVPYDAFRRGELPPPPVRPTQAAQDDEDEAYANARELPPPPMGALFGDGQRPRGSKRQQAEWAKNAG